MYYCLAFSRRFNFDIPCSCHSYSAMEHIIAITVRCYAPRKLILKTNFLLIFTVLMAETIWRMLSSRMWHCVVFCNVPTFHRKLQPSPSLPWWWRQYFTLKRRVKYVLDNAASHLRIQHSLYKSSCSSDRNLIYAWILLQQRMLHSKQDRQFRCNVALRRLRATMVAVEKQ